MSCIQLKCWGRLLSTRGCLAPDKRAFGAVFSSSFLIRIILSLEMLFEIVIGIEEASGLECSHK